MVWGAKLHMNVNQCSFQQIKKKKHCIFLGLSKTNKIKIVDFVYEKEKMQVKIL